MRRRKSSTGSSRTPFPSLMMIITTAIISVVLASSSFALVVEHHHHVHGFSPGKVSSFSCSSVMLSSSRRHFRQEVISARTLTSNTNIQLSQQPRSLSTETDNNYEEEIRLSSEPKNSNSNNNNQWKSLLVAAAFVTASLGNTGGEGVRVATAANAATTTTESASSSSLAAVEKTLDLVSPGTITIETSIFKNNNPSKVIQSTESIINDLVKTTLINKQNRIALSESVQKIKSSIVQEFNSVDAYQQVYNIIKMYGIDLKQDTNLMIRPPADYKRFYNDFITNQQINILINGEIIQFTAEHNTNINTDKPLAVPVVDGSSAGKSSSSTTSEIKPDDEWILRIRGYKGYDPNAVIQQLALKQNPLLLSSSQTFNTPEWYRNFKNYWNSSPQSLKGVPLVKTNGDVIVITGIAAIGISYAWSYAYYIERNEVAEVEAQNKKDQLKLKKTAAAAAKAKDTDTDTDTDTTKNKKGEKPKPKKKKKEKTPPPPSPPPKPIFVGKSKTTTNGTTESATTVITVKAEEADVVDDNDNVKVVIEFDSKGKVILKTYDTTTTTKRQSRPNSILSFLQALYFPWLGFFFSSTATSNDDNNNNNNNPRPPPKVVAFVQALYFPWAGIFFPSDNDNNNNEEKNVNDTTASAVATTNKNNNNNTGLIPLIRALWFPWIGILQGKMLLATMTKNVSVVSSMPMFLRNGIASF
ncbi:hypothetical protein FRACYDRAFT_245903 [Fragilariopsis cylindrus CCMP1102]|uniref:Uncharacterized protein n=1 Tax=Fragilariopsis cylindrus CCMP1102 TaxID=635003 RepID=A0A1E7F020_9STRA|nr:hypothetical protein FRACYDRAFT_245903 [Fragilariopsis cylindrus CCMP1102]|eukprot:OEU11404.1 hypothetical protein FRACYDRAFT_245903 [Fragilariopsis cylindrus CCMP1102]